MPYNPSVARFKADMQDLSKNMATNFHDLISNQADEVIENMRARVPVKSGNLRESIRKRDVSREDRVSFLILAGGPLTTKTSHGAPYDYALATEFGTVHERAEPFFYVSYRDYIQAGAQQDRETFEQTIEENNRVRALRAQNYSNNNLVISHSHRGAVVIHGRGR
jgi:HK97 gp10 family phage protein